MKKLLTLALLLFMLSSHEAFSKTYYFVFDSYVGRSGKISIVGQVKSIGNINANENTLQNMTWIGSSASKVGYGYIFQK
ncbi:MAG: hypothetical protein II445_07400, partial [Muribaculaceae bacterium]|nr:hypothetical protein [Muribaculaceae bacterium]